MFGWFKKAGEKKFEEKLKNVNEHLKNSFSLVKKDMGEIGNWMKELHENHEHHNKKFSHHEKRLESIEMKLHEIYTLLENNIEPAEEVEKLEFDEEEDFDFKQTAGSFSTLRNTEKEVFKQFSKLWKEKGKHVHMKDIAAEVYPEKEYAKIRTALSNHITALELFDFVYRKRIGREMYIGLTEHGKRFVEKIESEIKRSRTRKKATTKARKRR